MGLSPLMDLFCESTDTHFSSDLVSKVRFLLARGADATARDGNGRTPLIFALLRRGPAAAAATDLWLRRPEELEGDRRLVECLDLLLEGGADPRRKGRCGDKIGEGEALTPAQLADRYCLFDIARYSSWKIEIV